MQQRIFHGEITPKEMGEALVAHFQRANIAAQSFTNDRRVVVQISTRPRPISGGHTALTVLLEKVEDGVAVQIGEQAWLGVAASIGTTLLSIWRNPLNLLGRLDDIAQDIENLQLTDQVWSIIENYARMRGATFELSERLRRLTCEYCGTANPVGEPSCIACGAPLGAIQPGTCRNCGFVVKESDSVCPNCGFKLIAT